jgi:pimeloyl-ACP methyl ester carboxylesterase
MRFPGSGGRSPPLFGDGQVGVVVSNTIIGRACDWLRWAEELADRGYRVMLFNYSVLMPTTEVPEAVDTFARDTVEAAAMLRQMGVQKVALVGGSVGGLSALRAGFGRRGESRRDRLPVGIRLDRGHRLARWAAGTSPVRGGP